LNSKSLTSAHWTLLYYISLHFTWFSAHYTGEKW